MKSRFIIFRFVLMYLLAISVAGCGRDAATGTPELILTPMEQLTGEYTLVEFKYRIKNTTISVEPPTVFGKLVLGIEGKYFSLTIVIADDVSPVSEDGNALYDSWEVDEGSWNADETGLIMTLNEHNDTEYTGFEYIYDEKYLTLEGDDDGVMITMKWRKL